MRKKLLPVLQILDVIQLKREHMKQNTKNKSCYVLSCRISGESLFYFNNKEQIVKTGEILYIPYGATYSQKCENEEIICFHLEAYCDLPDEIKIFKTKDKEYICSLFKKSSYEWRSGAEKSAFRCMSILYEILAQIDINSSVRNVENPPCFNRAIKYLDSHIFDGDLTVSDLCEKSNISRAYFNKLFKESFGVKPTEYINVKKINKAKFLLKSGNYTNEEIANLSGYNDIKYFYTTFKKYTGLSTKQYKANHLD